jgi:hypothetical protein
MKRGDHLIKINESFDVLYNMTPLNFHWTIPLSGW